MRVCHKAVWLRSMGYDFEGRQAGGGIKFAPNTSQVTTHAWQERHSR